MQGVHTSGAAALSDPRRTRDSSHTPLWLVVLPTLSLWLSLLAGRFSLDRGLGVNLDVPLPLLLAFGTGLLTIFTSSGRLACSSPASWRPMWVSLLFAGLVLLSVLWSPDPSQSLSYGLELLLIPYYILIAVVLYRRYGQLFAGVLVALVVFTGLAYAVLGLATWGGSGRLAILGGGPNVYSRVVALGVTAALVVLLRNNWRKWVRACALVLIVVGPIAVILSGSRGGLTSLIVGVSLALISSWTARVRSVLVLLAGATVLALSLLTFGSDVVDYWNQRFVETTFEGRYLAARDDHFAFSWQLIQQHPWIGNGYGAYGFFRGVPGWWPHNFFLDLLVAVGVLGTLPIIAGMLSLAVRPLKLFRNQSSLAGPMLALAAVVMTSAQVSGGLYDSRLLWLFLSTAFLATLGPLRLGRSAAT